MVWSQLILAGIVRGTVSGLVVTHWLREARAATHRMDVTGGLLFDGECWMQLFEGRIDAIDAMVRLAAGHDGLGLDETFRCRSDTLRRDCARWTCGYVEPQVLAGLRAACGLPGGDAAPMFAAALTASDAS